MGKSAEQKTNGPRTQATNPARHEMPFIFSAFAEKIQPYARRNVNPTKSRTFGPDPKDRVFSPSFRLLFVPLAFFFFSLMSKVCGRSEGESEKKQHTHEFHPSCKSCKVSAVAWPMWPLTTLSLPPPARGHSIHHKLFNIVKSYR